MSEGRVILPVFPLRDWVLYPKITPAALPVGRAMTLRILEDLRDEPREVFVTCQKNPETDNPSPEDLCEIGVTALAEDLSIDEETGSRRVRFTGLSRGRIVSFVRTSPYLEAEINVLPDQYGGDDRTADLAQKLKNEFLRYIEREPKTSSQIERVVSSYITSPATLADFIASKIPLTANERQTVLEDLEIPHRLQRVLAFIEQTRGSDELERELQHGVRKQIERAQREYYLREKLKVIQQELGNDVDKPDRTGIRPIFASRISRIDTNLCFVLMPFSEKWSDRLYYKLIRPTIEDLGLQCIRADNLTGQIIIEDIWTKINQCGLIIADVTGRNPNVMYELGIVHTIGKPTILITQQIDDIPFDFAHLRHYSYQDNIDGFRELGETLRDVTVQMFEDAYGIDLAKSRSHGPPAVPGSSDDHG